MQAGHLDFTVDNGARGGGALKLVIEAWVLGVCRASALPDGPANGPEETKMGPRTMARPSITGPGNAELGTLPGLDPAHTCASPTSRHRTLWKEEFSALLPAAASGPVGQEGVVHSCGWILGDTSLWSWRWDCRGGTR